MEHKVSMSADVLMVHTSPPLPQLYEMAHSKMQELQAMNVSWIEAQFVKKAVDVLCQCRQVLMYSYCFAFYLKKNNHTFIFEVSHTHWPRVLFEGPGRGLFPRTTRGTWRWRQSVCQNTWRETLRKTPSLT